jgi:thioredoxin 1
LATIDINVNNFVNTMESNDVVIVEFYSPSCPHCKRFTPKFTKVSEQFPDVTFGLVNCSENQDLSTACEIRGFPTVVIYSKGKEINRKLGEQDEEVFTKFVKEIIEKEQ